MKRTIIARLTPEREAQYLTEKALLSSKGRELALALYRAYGAPRGDGNDPSPLAISQATELLRNSALRDQVRELLS